MKFGSKKYLLQHFNFMSSENFKHSSVEHEKSFILLGSDKT